jgi:hypothetical protein
VEFTFPNLYNNDPEFLHTVRAEHQRGSLFLGDSERVRMRVDEVVDADNDGLPDWWELRHGLEANNGTGRHGAAGDFDRDGVSNMEEYLFGMNPALDDAAVLPRVTVAPHATLARAWTLEFPVIPNRTYQWQVSETLDAASWANFGPPVSTAGSESAGVTRRDDTATPPKRFYRMVVMPVL